MTAQELDEIYTKLCHGLTAAGEASAPMVLARLAILLIQQSPSAEEASRAIDDALEGMDGRQG